MPAPDVRARPCRSVPVRVGVAQPPPAGVPPAVHPLHESELAWQLRKSRAYQVLEDIRVCYEGGLMVLAAAPDSVAEAERDVLRRIIDLHRAQQHGRPDLARRAAVRAAATCLAIILDLIPEESFPSPVDPSVGVAQPPPAGESSVSVRVSPCPSVSEPRP
jgi:hypothetical protein